MHPLILITLSLMLFGCSNTSPSGSAMDISTQENIAIQQASNSNTGTSAIPAASFPTVAPRMLKTALVIGNSNYKLMPLANPENDATDIAKKLEFMGFQVIFATNKSKLEIKQLIREFAQTLKQRSGVGLFFYAGHGVQIDGNNYLIPTDFNVKSAYEVSDSSIDVGLITGAMEEAGNPLNIIVLDACRDNPLGSCTVVRYHCSSDLF